MLQMGLLIYNIIRSCWRWSSLPARCWVKSKESSRTCALGSTPCTANSSEMISTHLHNSYDILSSSSDLVSRWECLDEQERRSLITHRNADGYTILMIAGCSQQVEFMQQLMECMHDLNKDVWDEVLSPASSNGNTFLHNIAVHHYTWALVEVLLQYPLQKRREILKICNEAGYCPLAVALVPAKKLQEESKKYLHTVTESSGIRRADVGYDFLRCTHGLTNQYFLEPPLWSSTHYVEVSEGSAPLLSLF